MLTNNVLYFIVTEDLINELHYLQTYLVGKYNNTLPM